MPAKDAAGVARFEDAHASRVSVAQLHDQLGTLPEHTTWIIGHLLREETERSAFRFIGRSSARAAG